MVWSKVRIRHWLGVLDTSIPQGNYADCNETLPEAVASIRFLVHRVLQMTPKVIWNVGAATWKKIKGHMKQARKQTNRRLRLDKRRYYIEKNVWICQSGRLKQFNEKFADFGLARGHSLGSCHICFERLSITLLIDKG